ncbi:MAG: class I SAM-dependent methyltransferase [Myxococcaceae bacterium]|nr:class I SAM-dependent methyltransferase [Myxococcaceae bacterium]
MEPLAVTTSSKTRRESGAVEAARAAAEKLGVPFVEAVKGTPVETLLTRFKCVLVLRGDGVVLLDERGSARWSGGMADLRIHRLRTGIPQPDHLLLAGEVRAGDAVLDCTLGRGHDALVLEEAGAQVTGIEASLPLYAWASLGLSQRGSSVKCVHGDAGDVLRGLPAASFDVVCFDPMFSKRAHYEAGFALVRRHGEAAALTAETLAEARRVARRWVVVKAAPQARELRELGLEVVPFKRNAELRFGRLRA